MTNEAVPAERDREVIAPPYVSFSTFKTLLDWLRSEGVPLRLDRSFWQGKFSGSTGAQLMAALRFLGLLKGDRPLEDLEGLVAASMDDRRFILKELLKDSYAAVPFDDLDRATPAMVRRWFRAYPVDGHTMRKAISFFVNAAREAEMPMSGAVRRMVRVKTTPVVRAAPRERAHVAPTDEAPTRRVVGEQLGTPGSPASGPGQGASGNRTTIVLESGGVVTMDVAVDLFQISAKDRQFVWSLVDLANSYQAAERSPDDTDANEGRTPDGEKGHRAARP
jgi:hypothetical protein